MLTNLNKIFDVKQYVGNLFIEDYLHISNIILENIFNHEELYITYESNAVIDLFNDKSNKSNYEDIRYMICNCIAFINHIDKVINYKEIPSIKINNFVKNVCNFIKDLLILYGNNKKEFELLKRTVDFDLNKEKDDFIKFIKSTFNKKVRKKGFASVFIDFIYYLIDLLNVIADHFDSLIIFKFKYDLRYDGANSNDYYCVRFNTRFVSIKLHKQIYNFNNY